MKGPLSDTLRIRHILDAITEIGHYVEGVNKEEFLNNSEKRFATIKQIEIIGEACNRITATIKTSHPDIPWAQIIGLRNISTHEYFNVSFHVIWDVAQYDLPVLKAKMKSLLTEIESKNQNDNTI